MASTLAEWQHYHTAMQVYRSVHKISPSYLHNTFHYAAEITGWYAHNKHRQESGHHWRRIIFTSKELKFGILLIPPSMQQTN